MDYQNIDKIVTFCVSEEEARQKLAWKLAKCHRVPADVFDNLDIMITKAYCPLWVFKGSFKAPWSCLKVVRNKNFNVYETNIPRTVDYFPVNGVAVGNFEFTISATFDSDIFFEREVFCSKEYSPSKMEKEATLYSLNYSSEEAWHNEKSQKYVDRVVFDKIKWQLPNECEEINYYMDYSYKSYNVLYGILNMEYQYKGKTYLCKMDAYGDFLCFNHPSSEKVSFQIDEDALKVDLKKTIKTSRFGWCCFWLFIVGGHLGVYAMVQESILGCILCVILMFMSVVYGFKMSGKQDEEHKEKKKIYNYQNSVRGRYQQKQNFNRMQKIYLLQCPLLESHKEELNKFLKSSKDLSPISSNWKEKAKEYNALIRHHEFLMVKYYTIMFSLVGFIIFYLIVF